MEQSVPKRRHAKFRRCGITQKKEYNIQNKSKFEIKKRSIPLRCVIPVVCVTDEREENVVKQHN